MVIGKSLSSTSLAEAVDHGLDRGMVIDAFARLSLIAIAVGVIVASVETWMKYAEAIGLTSIPQAA